MKNLKTLIIATVGTIIVAIIFYNIHKLLNSSIYTASDFPDEYRSLFKPTEISKFTTNASLQSKDASTNTLGLVSKKDSTYLLVYKIQTDTIPLDSIIKQATGTPIFSPMTVYRQISSGFMLVHYTDELIKSTVHIEIQTNDKLVIDLFDSHTFYAFGSIGNLGIRLSKNSPFGFFIKKGAYNSKNLNFNLAIIKKSASTYLILLGNPNNNIKQESLKKLMR